MPRFAFRVEETIQNMTGVVGLVLAGPVLERTHDLAVGDPIIVVTQAGKVLSHCTGFVLANWGPERRHWVTITVDALREDEIQIGSVVQAERD